MKACLPLTYFQQKDVIGLAKDLIGKSLHTNINGIHTAGIITETEAYNGIFDKACHAYDGRRTKRTESMYLNGGHAYVYLCYGIHSLFNIVTGSKNVPTAILIRAIEPIIGLNEILKRRNRPEIDSNLCSGPGTLTQALGIGLYHDKTSLDGPNIFLKEHFKPDDLPDIEVSQRIGVDHAGADAVLPYRFKYKKQ